MDSIGFELGEKDSHRVNNLLTLKLRQMREYQSKLNSAQQPTYDVGSESGSSDSSSESCRSTENRRCKKRRVQQPSRSSGAAPKGKVRAQTYKDGARRWYGKYSGAPATFVCGSALPKFEIRDTGTGNCHSDLKVLYEINHPKHPVYCLGRSARFFNIQHGETEVGLDIGANIGGASHSFVEHGAVKMVIYEPSRPQSDTLQLLEKNCKHAVFEMHNKAVDNFKGLVQFRDLENSRP